MLEMNEIRKGKMVVMDGQPYLVASADFLRKQQRRPVMRTILKHIKTGQTKEYTFQQSEKVQEADVQRKPYQFLYATGPKYAFMNLETYEQIELGDDVIGDAGKYLLEGEQVEIITFEDAPVNVHLPIKIDRKVIEAPPGVRGDTSSNVMKEAVIEGGAKVKVPLFINEGDTIRINTESGEYVERA